MDSGGTMKPNAVYAILGYPVHHSQSPAMHNAAFRELNLAATYIACEVRPDDLPVAVSGLRALGLSGANVTLPHKTAVRPLLDTLTREAQLIGAVNTLFFRDGALWGDNTDAAGLARALAEGGASLAAARVTVLGAGGAARAAVVGLARAGVTEIAILARDPAASAALVTELGTALAAGGCGLAAGGLDATTLSSRFAHTDLLVQATSATLGDTPGARDFAASLPIKALPDHAIVTDLVYKPLRTTVMAAAEGRQLRTVDGLGMLLHQGALAFERWTGRAAPLAVMREALVSSGSCAREAP